MTAPSVCKPLPVQGGACGEIDGTDSDVFCDETTDTYRELAAGAKKGVCTARVAVGDACTGTAECAAESKCIGAVCKAVSEPPCDGKALAAARPLALPNGP